MAMEIESHYILGIIFYWSVWGCPPPNTLFLGVHCCPTAWGPSYDVTKMCYYVRIMLLHHQLEIVSKEAESLEENRFSIEFFKSIINQFVKYYCITVSSNIPSNDI